MERTHTGWEVDWRVCEVHGESLHMSYVLDEQGNKIVTFEGDTRVAEEVGEVIYECISCQSVKWNEK